MTAISEMTGEKNKKKHKVLKKKKKQARAKFVLLSYECSNFPLLYSYYFFTFIKVNFTYSLKAKTEIHT